MDMKPTWLSTLSWEVNGKLCKTKNPSRVADLFFSPCFVEVILVQVKTAKMEYLRDWIQTFAVANSVVQVSISLSSANFWELKHTQNTMTDNLVTFPSFQALEMTQSKLSWSIWLWNSDRWDKLLLHKLWFRKQTALNENIYFGFTCLKCKKQMLYFHYVRPQENTQSVFRARKNHTGWEKILKCKQSIL